LFRSLKQFIVKRNSTKPWFFILCNNTSKTQAETIALRILFFCNFVAYWYITHFYILKIFPKERTHTHTHRHIDRKYGDILSSFFNQ
jgi:hypothetical protein